MKIITVLGPLPPRKGISQYVKGFVAGLGKQTKTQVLDFKKMYPNALYPGGNPKQDGVDIPEYDGVVSQQLLTWWNPLSWIYSGRKIQGELLHMQYWIRFLSPIYITVGFIARYIKKIPVIITVHNTKPHEITRWKMRLDSFVYKTATKLVVHSQTNKEQLQEIVGERKEIAIFPHGIIIPEIEKIDKTQARKQLNIAQEKKIILFFGVIRPYKGLHIALASLAELVKKDTSYYLIVAGKCWGEWQEYQDQIETLGLESHITRVSGFLDDIQLAQVFSASDFMILPYTHFDAQSGVVALGLGFELPMIVSNLGGLVDVIDDEKYICEVEDIQDLTSKIMLLDTQQSLTYIQDKKLEYSREKIIHDLFARY